MSLKDSFCSVPLREQAGARTADRYEYQLHWALCHLLGLHESGQDYLITFDYHDDILIFDSEADPQNVAFIQVKTKGKGRWTLNALIKRDKGAQGDLPSIIGKLYDNRLRFPDNTSSLTLLSNTGYNVSLADKRNSLAERKICVADLDENSRAAIRKSLQAEHGLDEEPVCEQITHLQTAELPLEGHATHVKGELSEFLDRLVPEGSFPVVRVYRVLMDDIRRRNNYNRVVSSFFELVEQKSIGRTEFQRMLDEICVTRDPAREWRDIEARLHSESVDLSTIFRLRNAWTRLEIRRMNPTDSHLRLMMDTVGREVKAILETENVANLADLLSRVLAKVRTNAVAGDAYSDDDLRAMALAKQYEL